jgi:hypothetical protein
MKRGALVLGLVLALLGVGGGTSASALTYFPGTGQYGSPPATQISRNFTLKDAAQRGLVKLTSKDNGFQGDDVSIELTNKKVRAPVTITIHAEFTTLGPPRADQDNLPTFVSDIARSTEADLNGLKMKSQNGDPIQFKLDWEYRAWNAPPQPNFHQITIIDPNSDLIEPDSKFRSQFDHAGKPNGQGNIMRGLFTVHTLSQQPVLDHETMHMAGLPDHYHDFYKVGNKTYPIPGRALKPSELEKFARNHRPPLPTNGKVVSLGDPGGDPCDMMGGGEFKPCHRVTKADQKFLSDQAGIVVSVAPGDILLNKDTGPGGVGSAGSQDMVVGYPTRIFASNGGTTTAPGVSVYCIDFHLAPPGKNNIFDVLGPASEQPGLDPLAKLISINAALQNTLSAPVPGMQTAIWNVTDDQQINESPAYGADEARAILNQAGIAEDSYPNGLPQTLDPNAGSPDTGAVSQSGVLDTIPSQRTKPLPTTTIRFGRLYPSPLRAHGVIRADLLVTVLGDASRLGIKVQQREGGQWSRPRKLGKKHKIEPGDNALPLKLGRLGPGRYRLKLAAGKGKTGATFQVPFRVR